MVAIPLDKINYNKVSKHANVLIFKEFYPKTKNVSYYLKHDYSTVKIKAVQSICSVLGENNVPVSVLDLFIIFFNAHRYYIL